MTKQTVTSILSAGLLLAASYTAVADGGFSVGASAARASVSVNDAAANIDGDATGYRLFGLYMFNRNFGIEAGISTFAEPDDNTIPTDMEVETDSFDVFAVGKYWPTDKLSLIGKAGFVESNVETEIGENEDTERSYSSTDFALSLGGQYDLNDRFGIRAEYEWRDGQDFGANRIVSLSGIMRF